MPGRHRRASRSRPLNSGLDVGNQTAVITANVETYAGVVVTQGSAEASLLLLNANGPALTLSFATPTVAEGSTVTATVTRNTGTTVALVVTLASTDPTAASVPATVTIPAGQASVSFTVDAVQNGVPEGMQQVQISATTTGLDTGLATLGITDVLLPDLVVSSVTCPGERLRQLAALHFVDRHQQRRLSRDRLVGGRGLISTRPAGPRARLRSTRSRLRARSTPARAIRRRSRSRPLRPSASISCAS